MRCPSLKDLPPPPPGRTGWPWTFGSDRVPDRRPDGTPWPRISIVTPSFNQGQYIEETIRSVLLQGYPDLEYLVIDGGSNDDSVDIIRKYSPWITHFVSEKDRGQSHAINKGFARATGDLITFQNSDDLFLPNAFGVVGSCVTGEEFGAIAGSFRFIEGTAMQDGSVEARMPGEGPVDLVLERLHTWRIHQVSVFYTRRALDAVNRMVREDLHYTMDRELLYRVSRAFKVRIVPETLGAFRRHPQGKCISDSYTADMEFVRLHEGYSYPAAENARRQRSVVRQWKAKAHLRRAVQGRGLLARFADVVVAVTCTPSLLRQKKTLRALIGIR